jgi:hypothetical protein
MHAMYIYIEIQKFGGLITHTKLNQMQFVTLLFYFACYELSNVV